MLRRMKDLKGLAIEAKDGDIGEANDFIFDDNAWTVRYLVVDTSRWLPGCKVLISSVVVGQADWEGKKLPVSLTREQVQNNPDIRVDEALSAQDEIKYFNYHGWPYYWAGDRLWGPVALPQEPIAQEVDRKTVLTEEINKSHLRSMKEMSGYTIQATDGEIGQVYDFTIDDKAWGIGYMVVDTRNWWSGEKVIVAPAWIAHVDWQHSNVYVNFSRASIKSGPEFDLEKLDRAYERQLYEHYGRDNYWWC
jgi:sporulation protein YlmC with PRC-barrel domain